MPRAGWCRECGEWIWVDEEGACQNGHGAECVEGVHDAQPRPSDRGVGEGEMPAGFNMFNWGAFLLPFFWGLAYGVWPVVSLWLIALVTPAVLVIFVGGDTASLGANAVGITVISEIVNGIIRIYIGANANRLLWRRENARLELVEGALPRVSIPRFIGRQRVWLIVGAILMAFSLALVGVVGFLGGEVGDQVRSQLGVTAIDSVASVVWLLAEVILGMWLASKMRQEAGEANPHGPAEDSV